MLQALNRPGWVPSGHPPPGACRCQHWNQALRSQYKQGSARWIMQTHSQKPDDRQLRALLRESCPAPDLLPGFQDAVWRRIERAERMARRPAAAAWLDRVALWFLRPRRALAAAAAMLLLGVSLGIAQGVSQANNLAKQRYLDSVSPPALRQ